MDDDLTYKLSEIVKYNNSLKKKIASFARPEIIEDWYNMVVYHIITFIDNEQPGISQSTHRSGRPLKAIRQRLKGKEGRLRSNLMGKRVDFSARSVITPDPNIDLDKMDKKSSDFHSKLATLYPEGKTVNKSSKGNKAITQVILVNGGRGIEYQEIKYSWGGVYYFRNGDPITKLVFDKETK
jgi:DNA-directed RNA polymerase beta' subunit